jgi:hypothetical protein
MALGTDHITAEQRVAVSDPRFDMRGTGQLEDDEGSGTGWTWVAVIMVAAMFIVSGFLDEESRTIGGATAAGVTDSYVANTTVPSTAVANAIRMERRSPKGY